MADTESILVKENVKLTKNSKGYTWEIRTIGTGENGLFTEADFKRQSKMEEQYYQEYGNKE